MIRPASIVAFTLLAWYAAAAGPGERLDAVSARQVPESQSAPPRNVVIILSDDHRYDFMGFMRRAPAFLETPSLDRMAAGGLHVRNAFVTTSLCSPSRASILTGQYAHRHGVVDNSSPIPRGTVFFPQHLQKAGYSTAYIGKWHMGEDAGSDQPRPGFDHWISFRGQGSYSDPMLNVNGRSSALRGYTTDILTDSAVAWLARRDRDAAGKPFFLVVAHKATHAEFVPPPRYATRYDSVKVPYPPTMANTEANYRDKPRWVRAQRGSWHGVDYAYHGTLDFDDFYRSYGETLLAMDDGVGRVLNELERSGLAQSTAVIYMSDNGFMLGEHGLIDKRNAYEESIRIPMIVWAPGWIAPGTTLDAPVRNIDIAPTVLHMAGVPWPDSLPLDGRSVLSALGPNVPALPVATRARGGTPAPTTNRGPSASEFLYEYYWEYAFPHTPTTFALRGERFKYIYYHGLWDLSELYDLRTDSLEQVNLINVPAFSDTARVMRARLFDRLEETGGMQVPIRRGDWQAAERKSP
jgi:N-acetylglucosamine-6-sulfatase